jgi:hypothetical protein
MDEEKYSRSSVNIDMEVDDQPPIDFRRRQVEHLPVFNVLKRHVSSIWITLLCLLIIMLEVYILFQSPPPTANYRVTSVFGTCQFTDWLDEQYRLSVCNSFNGFVIDIRQFLHGPEGIRPSVNGITLTLQEWNQLVNQTETLTRHIHQYMVDSELE